MTHFSIIFRIGILVVVFIPGCVIIQDKNISLSTNRLIYKQSKAIPSSDVLLVLGSGNTPDPASPNYSFQYRMKKTAELWRQGKAKKIIVSGISNRRFYNEPNDMKSELIKMGIPARVIYPDHGGKRTFVSMLRAKEIFPDSRITVISQRKQLEKALYIACCMHIEALGLEADPVPFKQTVVDDIFEMLSRVKCRWECYLNRSW